MKSTAIKAAKEAGKIILRYYSKNVDAVSKGNTYDLVTEADLASESKIISIIINTCSNISNRSYFSINNFSKKHI